MYAYKQIFEQSLLKSHWLLHTTCILLSKHNHNLSFLGQDRCFRIFTNKLNLYPIYLLALQKQGWFILEI